MTFTGLAMAIFHGPNRHRWAIPFWKKMGGYLTMANWQCHNQRVTFWTANFNSSTGLCTSSTWLLGFSIDSDASNAQKMLCKSSPILGPATYDFTMVGQLVNH